MEPLELMDRRQGKGAYSPAECRQFSAGVGKLRSKEQISAFGGPTFKNQTNPELLCRFFRLGATTGSIDCTHSEKKHSLGWFSRGVAVFHLLDRMVRSAQVSGGAYPRSGELSDGCFTEGSHRA